MHEPDIAQHIVAAGRGSFTDLMVALTDLHLRSSENEARLPESTAAQFQAGTAAVAVTPENFLAAHAPVVLTDAASVAVDMNAGNVFILTFTDDRAIANPTGHKVGQSGEFWLYNFTGAKELTWGAFYDFVGTPTTAQGAGALSCVRYRVVAAESILCTMTNA